MSLHAVLAAPATLPTWALLILLLAAKATLLLGAALVITRLMSRSTAAARHLVWLVTLGALLVMPALTTWTPVSLPVLAANSVRQAPGVAGAVVNAKPAASPVSRVAVADAPIAPSGAATVAPYPSTTTATATMAPRRVGGASLAPWIWGIIAIVVLGELVVSTLSLHRILRRAREIESSDWRTSVIEIADRLGLDEQPRVLVSTDTAMPFACGVRAPTIVLPEECATWSAERRRAVLLHELAHIRRRDMIGHLLGRIACACYWFHPLVWVAARRLRSESERACDDLAVTCGTRATDYAEHLLDIVIGVRRTRTLAVALAMARRSEFEGRMLAILDPELPHAAPSRTRTAALVGSLTLSAGLIAATKPVARAQPTAAIEQSQSMTAATPLTAHASVPVLVTTQSLTGSEKGTTGGGLRAPTTTTHVASKPEARSSKSAAQATPDDRPVLLSKILRSDSSAKLRRIAAWGLAEYSESSDGASALANAVRHDADASVRETSAWALANYDSHQDVAAALVAALRDANSDVRATAAWALGSIGDEDATTADALTAVLSDSSRAVRRRAAWALGSMPAKHAPPALIAMLRDPDPETRHLAAWALYNIQDAAAVPALTSALHAETDHDLQIDDLRALAAVGDQSVDAIRTLLESPDQRIKTMAVRALAGGQATGPWPWPWPDPRPGAP